MRTKIATFLVLTFALSSFFYYRIITLGSLSASGVSLYIFGLMWCPGIAGMLTQLIFHRTLKGLGWRWGKTRYQLWSYVITVAYAAAVYFPVWILSWGGRYAALVLTLVLHADARLYQLRHGVATRRASRKHAVIRSPLRGPRAG
jgi:hypothetical protein